jgi:UDP-N-acetylglucosamine 2-epimerase (non-hydrolysing)
MQELAAVVGTRPEIIKMAPVLRAAEGRFDLHLVHTGQHYDDELSGAFFEALELSPPDENLGIGSGSQAEQTAGALVGVEGVLEEREPAAVLAVGDTNAVLSTAMAAAKLPVAFGHVESGLRSFDRSMPEEVNRVLADHVADLAFAPTEEAREHLEREAVDDAAAIHVVGNTVVDACRQHAPLAADRSTVLERFGLAPGEYVAATIHRPANTDDHDRLVAVAEALDDARRPVVLPAHPRTEAALEAADWEPSGSLTLCEPLGYLDFLHLLASARVAVTDSGGVQEEASVLEVPCLTVRPNTERPETVAAGVNELVEPEELPGRLDRLLTDEEARAAMTGHTELYGDGHAGERIVSILEREL